MATAAETLRRQVPPVGRRGDFDQDGLHVERAIQLLSDGPIVPS
jgi:hypothetical protein